MRQFLWMFLGFILALSPSAWAQGQDFKDPDLNFYKPAVALPQPAAPAAPPPAAAPVPPPAAVRDLTKRFEDSLFFSPVELAAIEGAMKGTPGAGGAVVARAVKIPARRLIRLSGVVYRAANDWVVWMNGRKMTPKTRLPEVIDIEVHDSSRVSLKWYDVGLNQVIAITLRPHQTYDIGAGILLPGAGAP